MIRVSNWTPQQKVCCNCVVIPNAPRQKAQNIRVLKPTPQQKVLLHCVEATTPRQKVNWNRVSNWTPQQKVCCNCVVAPNAPRQKAQSIRVPKMTPLQKVQEISVYQRTLKEQSKKFENRKSIWHGLQFLARGSPNSTPLQKVTRNSVVQLSRNSRMRKFTAHQITTVNRTISTKSTNWFVSLTIGGAYQAPMPYP